MEIDIKGAYQSYLQIYESEKFEVLYDEDERPMMIREKKSMAAALTWFEWLIAEMETRIENEEYEYCAVIRDELKLIENETDDKELLEI